LWDAEVGLDVVPAVDADLVGEGLRERFLAGRCAAGDRVFDRNARSIPTRISGAR
jgi:hypothetical protein